MGYSHIPQKYAKPINEFFANTFNSWLNMHRPCLFATEVVDDKGKIKKVYKHADVKTGRSQVSCHKKLKKSRLIFWLFGLLGDRLVRIEVDLGHAAPVAGIF